MYWSAVSAFLVVLGASSNDLTQRELQAWKKVEPSIIYLMDGQSVRGTAALIDEKGFFLAHKTALEGSKVSGRWANGSKVSLTLVATDDPTQFVLLKANNWQSGSAPAISLSPADSSDRALLAITSNGPVRAERVANTYGVINPSRRFMPLSEVRMENNLNSLGGALLFNINGQFVGALNATLESPGIQNAYQNQMRGGAIRQSNDLNSRQAPVQIFGPGTMTTAYTISPKVMKRVIDGFKSDSHEVAHPAIGIFCRDAAPTGALIEIVSEGSTADKAGLRKGDVITSMNNVPVKNQFDFARIMLDAEVGDILTVWIKRSGLMQMIKVPVGK